LEELIEMNAEATSLRGRERVHTLPNSWSSPSSDAAVGAAARLMLVPVRLLSTSLGRRLAGATVLSIALVVMVSTLYSHADGPAGQSARATAAALSAAPAAANAAPAAARATAAPARAAAAKRPQDAAISWFARQKRVAASRVQALQQQRVSATVTRVLVMAQLGPADMPTALVTVRRDGTGWKVS
jgi:hypothetical protein